jgi:hypothetical protein
MVDIMVYANKQINIYSNLLLEKYPLTEYVYKLSYLILEDVFMKEA